MKTYFCPNCGFDLESDDLVGKKMIFYLTKHECPKCKNIIRPRLSCITISFFLTLLVSFWSLGSNSLYFIFFVGFVSLFCLYRLINQEILIYKSKKLNQKNFADTREGGGKF
jgi:predicted RNA-binding Zn-ribbon protein involved in translation (DUF1610 family)